jgi:hypothetical protein
MSWLDCVDESVFLKELFPDAAPLLTAVRLHEVQFHQDGPRAILRFDLNEFPETPPAKWRAAQSNTVQVRLMGIGISAMHMTGWAANNIGLLAIERGADDVRVAFDSSECSLRAVFEYLRVDGVSAFHSAPNGSVSGTRSNGLVNGSVSGVRGTRFQNGDDDDDDGGE